MDRLVDIHCHVLPIDDGAENIAQAVEMVERAYNEGVTDIIATPHFDSSHPENAEQFIAFRDNIASLLVSELEQQEIDVNLHCAAEIMLSPSILELPLDKLRLGGRYILVELPFVGCPIWLRDVFFELGLKGYIPVLAHCERYRYLRENEKLMFELFDSGVVFQVSGGAVFPKGADSRTAAKLIKNGVVSVVASDIHYKRTIPSWKKTYEYISAKYGEEFPQTLRENAYRILTGKPPEPIAPKKQSFISRIFMGA